MDKVMAQVDKAMRDVMTAGEAEALRRTFESVPDRPAMAGVRAALWDAYSTQKVLIAGEATRKIRAAENARCEATIQALGSGVLEATEAGWERLREMRPKIDRMARKTEPACDRFADLPSKKRIQYAEFFAAGLHEYLDAQKRGERRTFRWADEVPPGVVFRGQSDALEGNTERFFRLDERNGMAPHRRTYMRISNFGKPGQSEVQGWQDRNAYRPGTIEPQGVTHYGLNVDRYAPFVEVRKGDKLD